MEKFRIRGIHYKVKIEMFYSILRLRLSLDGEVNSPCGNLVTRICKQILAGQIIHFQCQFDLGYFKLKLLTKIFELNCIPATIPTVFVASRGRFELLSANPFSRSWSSKAESLLRESAETQPGLPRIHVSRRLHRVTPFKNATQPKSILCAKNHTLF
jgi:hypothetical protein